MNMKELIEEAIEETLNSSWTLKVLRSGEWREHKYSSQKIAMDKAYGLCQHMRKQARSGGKWHVIVLDPNGARFFSDHN